MMNICEKCGKKFKYNYLLERHNLKKNPCIIKEINNFEYNDIQKQINEINNNINKINNEIIKIENKINTITLKSLNTLNNCLFCKKLFTHKSNLSRHITNNCNLKKELINNKNNLVQNITNYNVEKNKLLEEQKNNKMEIEMQSMKKMMTEMMEKISETKNIQHITNNNNNIQNNLIVNINSFGNEDLSHITQADYKKYLNTFFKGFTGFIEKIYFDETVPSNHNICINNIKSPYMYVFENNAWKLKDKSDVIDNLITNKYILLNEKCEELEENNEISNKIVNNFKEFTENYENIEAQKNTKKDVMLLIYNNKDKVKDKVKDKEKEKDSIIVKKTKVNKN